MDRITRVPGVKYETWTMAGMLEETEFCGEKPTYSYIMLRIVRQEIYRHS